MKYEHIWRKTLNESEKVEYEFSVAKGYKNLVLYNAIAWGVLWCLVAIASPFFLIIGILSFIIGAIAYWYLGLNAYAFTSKRVLIHTGWLSTSATSINYDKIMEISVSEPFIQRLMTKSGNLVIKTAGYVGHDIVLKSIEAPYEIKKTLDRLSHQS